MDIKRAGTQPSGKGPSRVPRVICHMMSSVDGRIVVDRWPDFAKGRQEYERTAATYNADGWMCGRITMAPFAGACRTDEEIERDRSARSPNQTERSDFVSTSTHVAYAIALDPSGRLRWATNDIDGDHVVAVLSNSVSDDYLAQLRERGVSYIIATPPRDAAEGEVGLDVALEKLAALFGIRTLLLEGGGSVNGSMLRAGLIEEVSLLVAPVADGGVNVPTLFDIGAAAATGSATLLELGRVERCAHDILWLRYRVRPVREGQT